MTARVEGWEKFDPWFDNCTDTQRCWAVVEAIARAAEHYDELFALPAVVGSSPLERWIDVEGTGVTVRVFLAHPIRVIRILSVYDLEDAHTSLGRTYALASERVVLP